MKLRILDDSLRLRLPHSDIARLRAHGRVEAAIHFGPGPRQRLVYALVVSPTAQRMSAVITEGEIAVHLPAQLAHEWIETDEVGLRGEQSVGEGRTLSLLIEKDFKCVVPREGEGEYDGFANPNASC